MPYVATIVLYRNAIRRVIPRPFKKPGGEANTLNAESALGYTETVVLFTGELLSVAPWVIKQVPNLFALSERVLLGGYWEHGFFSLMAVGAYNVGSIEIDMDKV